ncbi:MAG: hypothetical protein LBT59_19650 [Clostridiales bacterium]|jgi:hypothetical protein|nr:hypothetical protein [Clostridiales bacterium]
MARKFFTGFLVNSNAPPVQKLFKRLALCLAVLLAMALATGTTHAWFVSIGIIQASSVSAEKVKLQVGNLMRRSGSKWVVIDDSEVSQFLLEDSANALRAKDRLEQAISAYPSNPEDWYSDSDFSFIEDTETAMATQFKLSVENMGDDALVYIDTSNILGVELATTAFLTPDYPVALPEDKEPPFIWFEDAVLASASELGLDPLNLDGALVNAENLGLALEALNFAILEAEETCSNHEYLVLQEVYKSAIAEANASGDPDLAQAAISAKIALDSAVEAKASYKEAEANLKRLLKQLQDIDLLVQAFAKVNDAIDSVSDESNSESAIVNGRLMAIDATSNEPRPISLPELEWLIEDESDNTNHPKLLSASIFLRYGDLATQLTTPISEAFAREDKAAFIAKLSTGAKLDVVIDLTYDSQISSNVLNGAKLWLAKNDAIASAVNNSKEALLNIFGLSSDAETDVIYDTINGQRLDFAPIEVSNALDYGGDSNED